MTIKVIPRKHGNSLRIIFPKNLSGSMILNLIKK